jgi:hypothetical protein
MDHERDRMVKADAAPLVQRRLPPLLHAWLSMTMAMREKGCAGTMPDMSFNMPRPSALVERDVASQA